MSTREAKRLAHRWVADVIEAALDNGSGDPTFIERSDADGDRIRAAIQEIADTHSRKGGTR